MKKTQDTRNIVIGQWGLSPLQSKHLGTSHSSPNSHQLPCPILLNLINGLKSRLFQSFSFWEKPEVTGHQVWAIGGWVTWVIWCLVKKLHTIRDAWAGTLLSWRSSQSPTRAFWIIQIVSTEERSSLMQSLMQIHCSTQSFWMWQPHSTHTYTMASTASID